MEVKSGDAWQAPRATKFEEAAATLAGVEDADVNIWKLDGR